MKKQHAKQEDQGRSQDLHITFDILKSSPAEQHRI